MKREYTVEIAVKPHKLPADLDAFMEALEHWGFLGPSVTIDPDAGVVKVLGQIVGDNPFGVQVSGAAAIREALIKAGSEIRREGGNPFAEIVVSSGAVPFDPAGLDTDIVTPL